MNTEELYIKFRKAQAAYNGRPYRLPKDIEAHIQTKMNKQSREALEQAVAYFLTKWQNINVDKFLECGFEVFGRGFTYIKFFDRKVIELYIRRDKNEKREMEISKKRLIESAKNIKKYLQENDLTLKHYCRKRNQHQLIVVEHYHKGIVDKLLFVYLHMIKYILLEDNDKAEIPYIIEQYREIRRVANDLDGFLTQIQNLLEDLQG